jgi:putative ABC transport system substrate-binding protein
MQRRDLVLLFGGTLALPRVGRSQDSARPVIGFLNSGSPKPYAHLVAAFRKGLAESGYVEGRNVSIAFAWAESQVQRLPALAEELVRRKVDVIAATGGEAAAMAAKRATTAIPIVFAGGGDPVRLGLVESLNAPGGNLTGISFLVQTLEGKRLELLRELVPGAKLVGLLFDTSNTDPAAQLKDATEAARQLGLQLHVANASTEVELSNAFSAFDRNRVAAIMLGASPFFQEKRTTIIGLANRHRLPAIYFIPAFTASGGLASYGPSIPEGYAQVGRYVARILKGERPADLPVLQASKIEFVINMKTARAQGLTVPPAWFARADEVIE